MIDLYIYYQVGADTAAMLLPRVMAMQSRLAAEHGLVPQLKRRPHADEAGRQTWMEVYPAAADDFAARVEAAVSDAGLLGATGPRHGEVFVDLMTDLMTDLTMDLTPCA